MELKRRKSHDEPEPPSLALLPRDILLLLPEYLLDWSATPALLNRHIARDALALRATCRATRALIPLYRDCRFICTARDIMGCFHTHALRAALHTLVVDLELHRRWRSQAPADNRGAFALQYPAIAAQPIKPARVSDAPPCTVITGLRELVVAPDERRDGASAAGANVAFALWLIQTLEPANFDTLQEISLPLPAIIALAKRCADLDRRLLSLQSLMIAASADPLDTATPDTQMHIIRALFHPRNAGHARVYDCDGKPAWKAALSQWASEMKSTPGGSGPIPSAHGEQQSIPSFVATCHAIAGVARLPSLMSKAIIEPQCGIPLALCTRTARARMLLRGYLHDQPADRSCLVYLCLLAAQIITSTPIKAPANPSLSGRILESYDIWCAVLANTAGGPSYVTLATRLSKTPSFAWASRLIDESANPTDFTREEWLAAFLVGTIGSPRAAIALNMGIPTYQYNVQRGKYESQALTEYVERLRNILPRVWDRHPKFILRTWLVAYWAYKTRRTWHVAFLAQCLALHPTALVQPPPPQFFRSPAYTALETVREEAVMPSNLCYPYPAKAMANDAATSRIVAYFELI